MSLLHKAEQAFEEATTEQWPSKLHVTPIPHPSTRVGEARLQTGWAKGLDDAIMLEEACILEDAATEDEAAIDDEAAMDDEGRTEDDA